MGVNPKSDFKSSPEEAGTPNTSVAPDVEADASMAAAIRRAEELRATGADRRHALSVAFLEQRVAQWPSAWGDDLWIVLYGDFDPPASRLEFPHLGITIEPDRLDRSVVPTARTALRATVTIPEKSTAGITDAIRRINILLGSWVLVNWGNATLGWWCLWSEGGGGVLLNLEHEEWKEASEAIALLPESVRRKVDAALYWIREPRNLIFERHRSDILSRYAGYWNAFECLVDAVLYYRPMPKLTKLEKQRRLDEFLKSCEGRVTPEIIVECHRAVIDPGLVGRASHALQVCCPKDSARYIHECFKRPDRKNRLYDIRNSINHGDVDAENLTELLRIEYRLAQVQIIVLRLFACLVPFSSPVDTPTE